MKTIFLILLILGIYILINLAAIRYLASYGYMLSLFKKSEHYQKVKSAQEKWNVPVWVGEFIWETQAPRNLFMIPTFLWFRFSNFKYSADDSMARIVNEEPGWGWSYWEYEKGAFGDEKLNSIFSKYMKGSWRTSDPIPKLVARGKEIQTEDGKTVILKGPNLPLKHLATWGELQVSEEIFQKLEDMGANVVRIIINLDVTIPEEGEWSQKSIETLKQALNLVEKHHIYVILDIHKYRCSGFPKWYMKRVSDSGPNCEKFNQMWLKKQPPLEDSWDFIVEGWKKIIEISKGRNIVIGYDLFNEPGRGYELYEYLSAKITSLDPEKIHFAETQHLFRGMESDEKPEINNLVLSPHLYDIWKRNFFIVMIITSTLLPIILIPIFLIIRRRRRRRR